MRGIRGIRLLRSPRMFTHLCWKGNKTVLIRMPRSKNDFYFDEHKIEADHGQKSLRGGALSIIARAVNALIQVGSVLFLARLLSPEDYGLVSMVTAITGFAPLLVDLGTRDAIVQRDR